MRSPESTHPPEAIVAIESTAEQMVSGTEMETQSEERAKMFQQDVGDFENFATDERTGDRLPSTPEQEIEMDKTLGALHDLFSESTVPWRLDGALNISIYKGEYIGHHKDVDLSIPGDVSSLEAMNDWLGKHGYGLFLSQHRGMAEANDRHVLQRTDGRGVLVGEENGQHVGIAAIDERGAIRREVPLNFIDVHVNTLDVSGGIREHNVVLPPAWTKPQPRTFHGVELNTSHPALTTYYKLHQTRSYDQLDVQKIVESGALTEDDINELGQVMKRERLAVDERIERVLGTIADHITPDMDIAVATQEWLNDPEVSANIKRGMKKEVVSEAAAVMLNHATEGRDKMLRATADHLGMQARFLDWERNVAQLRFLWDKHEHTT